LVHGDLWGGNWFTSDGGEPVLIDPAAYRGHGEVDLAMSELFGGFGAAFYEAYDDVAVVEEAYSAYRKDLYQLYYLLVHVNLFGGGYEDGSLRAARRVISEVG
jgi:fructosamine-3-kinase